MEPHNDSLLQQIIRPRLVSLPADPVCTACRSDAIAVAECEPCGDRRWRLVVRCGACETWQTMLLSGTHTDRLFLTVERGFTAIERDLDAIDREQMAAQVEAFVEALARDLIDATDFG